MSIAYYITAHGFGHFVRSAAVIKELPAEIPLIVRTMIPQWFLEQELAGRRYTSMPAAFDCGTTGPDASAVDIEASFRRASEVMHANELRAEEEMRFLRSNGVRVVVTDTPSFPLKIARRCGIPSICITNFTWVEIYQALAERAMREGRHELATLGEGLVSRMRREYAEGDFLLVPQMALPMEACRHKLDVPVIARTGRPRREMLCQRLGLDPVRPLYLVYLGREGYEGMDWARLRDFPDAQFCSFTAIPEAGDLIHVIPPGFMDHSDATATADAVIGKLGYSQCAECAAALRPLIHPPRPDFIEAEALGGAMRGWGLGLPVDAGDFRNLNIGAELEQARSLEGTLAPVDCSGAQICAEVIKVAWMEGKIIWI